jgi:hypothetical protein
MRFQPGHRLCGFQPAKEAHSDFRHNCPCDTKSCTTLVPLQPAESESNNHEQRHPELKKNCDQCRRRHTGAKWQKMAAFHHPVTGQLVSPLAEKPAEIQGEWGVGCVLCGNFVASGGDGRGRANAFAKFRVRGSTLQSSEIIRHCQSKLHSNALAALTAPDLQPAASTESDEKPEGYGVATCAAEHVPRSEKFVWAIMVCHGAGSDMDYKKFCQESDLTSYLSSDGKMTDSSRRIYK